MKRTITHLFLLVALVITGCESAQVPMGSPGEVAFDEGLIGNWEAKGDNDEIVSFLSISALSDTEYALIYKEPDEDESEQLNLKAFASSVDGVLFANFTCSICDDDDDEKEAEWYFYTFSFESKDIIVSKSLAEDVYKKGLDDLKNPAQVRSYIQAHMNDKEFFEQETARFSRVKNP